jgi:predicted SnoaL-like aldol condensation-catalyzing enzyme
LLTRGVHPPGIIITNPPLRPTPPYGRVTTTSLSSSSSKEKENETLAHRFDMAIFRKGNLTVADEICAPDFLLRNPRLPSEPQSGPEAAKKFPSAVVDNIPDRQFSHEDTIAEGDKVLISRTVTGSPKLETVKITPTGKPMTMTGFDLFRISDT